MIMKNLLILSILFSLLFAGCVTENLITEEPAATGQNLVWLNISDNSIKTEAEVVITKSINGNQGGRLLFNELIGKVEISGSLTVSPGAYSGNQNISVTLNDGYLYQVYKPSPFVFRSPLILNLLYKNVDLSGIDVNKVGFYFLSENGTYYKADYDSLIFDVEKRTIGITGAKIPHFSRWGWAKSEE
jgi:hypothetical protein